MSCETRDEKIYAGESAKWLFTAYDRNGDPVDLTGATIELEIKLNKGDADPALVHKEVGAGITVLAQSGATLGQFEAALVPNDTGARSGMHYWDVVVVSGGERWFVVPPSEFYIEPVVNRP